MEELLPTDEIGDSTPTDEQLAGDNFVFGPEVWNDGTAERMFRRLLRAQRRIIEATLQRDAWLAPINQWYDDVAAPDRRIVERLTASLESYAIAERVRTNNDRKTVVLPSGDIATRRATELTVSIVDEKAVLVWAADALDGPTYQRIVRGNPSVRVSELRKVVKVVVVGGDDDAHDAVLDHDGNFVPGVIIEYPTTTATVKPGEF